MPNRVRTGTSGVVFHVMNRGAKRARLFEQAPDYVAFLRVLAEAQSSGEPEAWFGVAFARDVRGDPGAAEAYHAALGGKLSDTEEAYAREAVARLGRTTPER